MLKEISLEEVKKFWPQSAPNINNIKKYVKKYHNEKIVIKYGGNVLIDRDIFNNFIDDINILNKLGLSIVVVHGGGPRIKRELDKSNIQTKFIRGLRVTDKKIIKKLGGLQGIKPKKLNKEVGSCADRSFIQPKKGWCLISKDMNNIL